MDESGDDGGNDVNKSGDDGDDDGDDWCHEIVMRAKSTEIRTSPMTTASISLFARSLVPVPLSVVSDLLGFRTSPLVF